jgi:hypothetical protein
MMLSLATSGRNSDEQTACSQGRTLTGQTRFFRGFILQNNTSPVCTVFFALLMELALDNLRRPTVVESRDAEERDLLRAPPERIDLLFPQRAHISKQALLPAEGSPFTLHASNLTFVS